MSETIYTRIDDTTIKISIPVPATTKDTEYKYQDLIEKRFRLQEELDSVTGELNKQITSITAEIKEVDDIMAECAKLEISEKPVEPVEESIEKPVGKTNEA